MELFKRLKPEGVRKVAIILASILVMIYNVLKGGTMPQISLYIDRETMKKIERVAGESNMSISRWVRENLRNVLSDEYPQGFFDLFGAVDDDSFRRPDQPGFDSDAKRESL